MDASPSGTSEAEMAADGLDGLLAVEPPDVVAVVRDTGRWRAPRGRHRGRGSTLMAELSDEVSVNRTDGGTQVIIRRALDRSGS